MNKSNVNAIGRQWIFVAAYQIHIIWSIVLIVGGEPSGWCTAIAGSLKIFNGNYILLACFYMLSSALVVLSSYRNKADLLGLLLYVPQQTAMLCSSGSAFIAIITQKFADGVVRPWSFITNDQIPYLLLGIFHSFALFDIFAGEWLMIQWKRIRKSSK